MIVAEANGALTDEETGLTLSPDDARGAIAATLIDPSDIAKVAEYIWRYMQEQGIATKDEVRKACQIAGVPTPVYQKAFEQLRKHNLLTERSADGGKVWALQEWANQMSLPDALALLEAAAGNKKKGEEYRGWYTVTGTMRLLTSCLAPVPHPQDASARVFERLGDRITLLPFYYGAMFKRAALSPGAPPIGNARYRVVWELATVPESELGVTLRPVPPQREGLPGQGITTCESLGAGSLIPFAAVAPGSHITSAQFEQIMVIAGRFVGFSPAAAKHGYGRFELCALEAAAQDEAA